MSETNTARLFWVVDSPEDNQEIFQTRAEADAYAQTTYSKQEPYRIYIAEVKNYYWDEQANGWNYDDVHDTFSGFQFTITVQNDTRGVQG